ncbi:MAG: nitroreductase [Proteobacteria bacterium]|nr:nitroreductase [Pseudomonadota bacterium]
MYPEQPLPEALERLSSRRSVKAIDLQEPGPDAPALDAILDAALRVPDHGKLGPWRLVTFSGPARAEFGRILATRWQALNAHANDAQVLFEQNRLLRAPVVVAVISARQPDHKIPEWEQILSAGAVCQNLLIAANLAGFAAQWLTEWYAYDAYIQSLFDVGESEDIAGFIYIGSAASKPSERPRPENQSRIQRWQQR